MLKSTYKTSDGAQATSLPEGWTEHKAPSGHLYYHNASTKISTYVRPAPLAQRHIPPDQDDVTFTSSFPGATAREPHGDGPNGASHDSISNGSHNPADRQPRPHRHRDRPKKTMKIPGSEPWVLVKTRLGRRFVYNPVINSSFWKFPAEVMKNVVEMDRLDREQVAKAEGKALRRSSGEDDDLVDTRMPVEDFLADVGEEPRVAPRPTTEAQRPADAPVGSDDEYEEVEVTDSEGEGDQPRISQTQDDAQPVEFDENDIAFQLQAMGQDYGLDPGEYGDGEDADMDAETEGLPITEEDSKALFTDLLTDYSLNPYSTWENIIEAGHIIEDDRYTVLPNMRARKEVWAEWSRNRIQILKERRENEAKQDPRIPYFAFLQAYATPKLYWPEFRRKYNKEPELRNSKVTDKDREKWYREYITRLKMPESNLKGDLIQALKKTPLSILNRSTTLQDIPPTLLTDICYITLRPSVRDPLIEAYITTLAPAPTDTTVTQANEKASAQEQHDRSRREAALAERQRQVQQQQRKQQMDLQHSRGLLREGEEEIERALKVNRKDGLLGHRIDL